MERDAILAHGASFFLKERLCALSDAFKTVACSSCGNFATPKTIENKIVCTSCKRTDSEQGEDGFGQITVPYAFTLLRNLIAGLNIELKFEFKERNYTVGDALSDEFDREELESLEGEVSLPGDEGEDNNADYDEEGDYSGGEYEESGGLDVGDTYDL